MSHIFRPDFFPWHQLTELTSSMSVTTTTALDILRHCHRLQICRLRDLEPVDVLHQPPLCILNEMRTLDLSADSDLPFIGFLDSLAFPLLNKLILECFSLRGDSLLGLQRRSQSPIHLLAIESLRLTADEIIRLLHLMPSLETFFVTYSHCVGNIFAALTYRGDPTLVLPNLHELAVQEDSGLLSWMTDADDGADGVAVVEMAESLERYPGPLNVCLPSIRSVELHLVGPKFSPALEARLAAVCRTGCVVDHCVDERYDP
ncbi:hypothetical protein B0H11DRAFT_2235317 [Mycena galericulata]|nr:hypothetical protein B0H11DRAFT_2235317 [Mycena galericulata]